MKNDRNNLDLESLLAEVEHAGRDARRRQELCDMVDRMGGVGRHGFGWWSVRVVAAACVLFFVSTAVRIWFIPTGTDATLVAEADKPALPAQAGESPMRDDCADTVMASPGQRVTIRKAIAETPVAVEEYVAEELPAEVEAPVAVEAVAGPDTAVAIVEDILPEPAAVAMTDDQVPATTDDIVAPTVSADASAPAAEAQKPKRESFLRKFFVSPDESEMDGTVLALRLM